MVDVANLCRAPSPTFQVPDLFCIQPRCHAGWHRDEQGTTWFSAPDGDDEAIRAGSVICGRTHLP
jgi:hypothetical protein